jgi:hypothetical protein
MLDETPVIQTGGAGTLKFIPDRTKITEFEALVVFVDFSDAVGKPEVATKEYFNEVIYPRLFGKDDEMQRWFFEKSRGKVKINVRVVPGWRRLNKSEEFYSTEVNGAWNWQSFVRDVPEAIFKTGHPLKSNTIVYALMPASAGEKCAPFNSGGACHAFNYKLPYDDGPASFIHMGADYVRLEKDVQDLRLTDPSAVIHETLHWFGLPDLYPTKAPYNHEVGPWDMMAMCPNALGIMGWNLHVLRWLEDNRKKYIYSTDGKLQRFKLTSLNHESGLFMIMVPDKIQTPHEPGGFWLIELNQQSQSLHLENRQRETKTIRADSTGVLIYRIRPGYAGGRVLKVYHRDFPEGKPFAEELANNSLYEEGDVFLHPDAPMIVKILGTDLEGTEIELTIKKALQGVVLESK